MLLLHLFELLLDLAEPLVHAVLAEQGEEDDQDRDDEARGDDVPAEPVRAKQQKRREDRCGDREDAQDAASIVSGHHALVIDGATLPRLMGKERAVFVDLLRLVASLQMVQGHTLDGLLADAHRSGPVFEAWTWSRGLTSVAFLFAAGLSFHLATLTRLDAHLADPLGPRSRFERGAVLIVLGYAMHAPDGPIVDVLQCIGLTLLLLEGLAFATRDARSVVVGAGVLALSLAMIAPAANAVVPSGLIAPLAHWITPRGGSIFPIVPWAAYMLAGVVCGAIVLPEGARTPRWSSVRRLAIIGVATVGGALVAERAGAAGASWMVKLGAVALVCAVLAAAAIGAPRLPRLFETLAGETLALYLSHVIVLYAAGIGLAHVIGRTVPLVPALAIAAVAVVLTALVGLAWNRAKRALTRRRGALAGTPRTG